MNSSLLDCQNVIVQGITGAQGSFHTRSMLAAGTKIVAGTSPNKAGQRIEGVPVYENIEAIQAIHRVEASIIFVPAVHAKHAITEAVDANIPLIVCITEGIPIHDMLYIKQYMTGKRSVLIGPNCPGVLLPGICKLGIIPAEIGLSGSVGVVSRSGTLTYEAVAGLSGRGIGQKYIIGIGGDPIRGTSFVDCLELFEKDKDIDRIVLIGEIGGNDEVIAAHYIQNHVTKPVYTYVAGHHAPAGVQLGHAGAILGSDQESASHKTDALRAAGAYTATNIAALIELVASAKQ